MPGAPFGDAEESFVLVSMDGQELEISGARAAQGAKMVLRVVAALSLFVDRPGVPGPEVYAEGREALRELETLLDGVSHGNA